FGSPDAAPDPRKWQRLETHLSQLGVNFSTTPDRWSGPRPTLPDYLPAIGRLKAKANILYAFGHHHLGMTMGAVTSELIEALVKESAPPLDTSPFRVERF